METKGLGAHPLRPSRGQSAVTQSLVLRVIQPDNRACKEPKYWTMCVDLLVPTLCFTHSPWDFSLFLSLLSVWANRECAVPESLVLYRHKNPSEAAVAVSVAERSSNIPEYLGNEQKQVSDYTLSPLIATERDNQREETESLSLLVFKSHENVICKIFRSSIIQDRASKAFVTVSSSLSIPNTQRDTQS